MSMATRYHTRLWAEGKSAAEISARITELQTAPEWKGVEFDDVRVRHMRQTEIDTLTELLATVRVACPDCGLVPEDEERCTEPDCPSRGPWRSLVTCEAHSWVSTYDDGPEMHCDDCKADHPNNPKTSRDRCERCRRGLPCMRHL